MNICNGIGILPSPAGFRSRSAMMYPIGSWKPRISGRKFNGGGKGIPPPAPPNGARRWSKIPNGPRASFAENIAFDIKRPPLKQKKSQMIEIVEFFAHSKIQKNFRIFLKIFEFELEEKKTQNAGNEWNEINTKKKVGIDP